MQRFTQVTVLLTLLWLLPGCSMSRRAVQLERETVIAPQTVIVREPLDMGPATTYTPRPSHTPRPTYTPRPPHTPRPTYTPRPPHTPRMPTAVPDAPNQAVRFALDRTDEIDNVVARVSEVRLLPVAQYLQECGIYGARTVMPDGTVTVGVISLSVANLGGDMVSVSPMYGVVVVGNEQADIVYGLSDRFDLIKDGEIVSGVACFCLVRTLPGEARTIRVWLPAPGEFGPPWSDECFEFYGQR